MIRTMTISRFAIAAAVIGLAVGALAVADHCCDEPLEDIHTDSGHYHEAADTCDHDHADAHDHANGHVHDHAAADACCGESEGGVAPEAGHHHGHDHGHGSATVHVPEKPAAPPAWDAAIVDKFRSLPVQDRGRVKPLETVARFTLMQLSGRVTAVNGDGEKQTPMEWLLDCLFYPRYAEHGKVFLIQSPDVMYTLGLDHDAPRDRFSHAQLRPVRARLFQLAQQAAGLEAVERTRVQEQLVNLAHNMNEFEMLTHYFEFARRDFPVGESVTLKELFGGAETVSYSEALARGPEAVEALIALRQGHMDGPGDVSHQAEMTHVADFFRRLEHASDTAYSLAFFPPGLGSENDAEWLAPGEMLLHFIEPPADHEEQSALLAELEALEQTKADPVAFGAHLDRLHEGVTSLAAQRGEYRGVPLEAAYYQLGLLDYGLYLYVLAFILAAFAWMRPHSRILWWAAVIAASAPLTLHTAAIVIRSIIRLRPPATTLYETILFTAAVAVLCALIMEWINRRRIGVGVAGFIGALGLFLASRYEVQEGIDTMPPLIAVLDTNFWLSIHVITMVMGYAGSLLAAGIAHVYLFGKAFKFKQTDKDFYKSLTRMTYGALCFALLFNTSGTVIGGLWAADSWGRFWGWDPKENGALLVVLWGLILLHARMGGYIRDHGLQMGAVFGGITVAFAWFGVNLLGVGLHSYGFTDGVHGALNTFYYSQSAVLFLGAVGWMRAEGVLRLSGPPDIKGGS